MTDRAPRPEGMSDEQLEKIWDRRGESNVLNDFDALFSEIRRLREERDEANRALDVALRASAAGNTAAIYRERERDEAMDVVSNVIAGDISTPHCYGQRNAFEKRLYELWVRVKQTADAAVRSDEHARAHVASFGALQTLSAALLDGEVDDYAALAEKIIGRVRQLEADGATLRERVRKLPTPLFCSTNKCKCDWCGAEFGRKQQHPMNDCLYAEVWANEIAADATASAPKEPTPR